jgi:hypothetical protein
MKKYLNLPLALLATAALALPLAAQAQSAAADTATAKPAVKKKHVAHKPARKTKKGMSHKKAKAIEAEVPAQTPTERLSDAELQTAQEVYTGAFPCELGEQVAVTADAEHPGFFTVASGKLRYYMHPVESRTGAVRLEDTRHSAVWLQLGSKSMLMDQKEGKRVADNCQASTQKDYAAHAHDHPQQQLLDTPDNDQPVPAGAASVPADK